tara:strand:- start:8138 stop:8338 length:201 start_codon:yes stop_codon:yes gene_type:complete
LRHTGELTPHHLMIRVNCRAVRSATSPAASPYDWLENGCLLNGNVAHPAFGKYWHGAQSDSFAFAV